MTSPLCTLVPWPAREGKGQIISKTSSHSGMLWSECTLFSWTIFLQEKLVLWSFTSMGTTSVSAQQEPAYIPLKGPLASALSPTSSWGMLPKLILIPGLKKMAVSGLLVKCTYLYSWMWWPWPQGHSRGGQKLSSAFSQPHSTWFLWGQPSSWACRCCGSPPWLQSCSAAY